MRAPFEENPKPEVDVFPTVPQETVLPLPPTGMKSAQVCGLPTRLPARKLDPPDYLREEATRQKAPVVELPRYVRTMVAIVILGKIIKSSM
jgi:hypothetical protein